MKKIPYWDIVKKSLIVTWKNKFLWLFGFFILLGSVVPSINGRFNISESRLIDKVAENNFSVIIAIVTTVIIVLMLIALKFLATAAIIKSANNISVYSQSPIKSILSESKKYIAKLFFLQLFIALVIVTVFVAMLAPAAYLFSLENGYLSGLYFIVTAVIVCGLFLLAYFIVRYAQIFLVLTDVKIKFAIEMAYNLLEKNLKESFLMAFVVIGLSLTSLFALIILFLITALIISPLALIGYFVFSKAIIVIYAFVAIIFIVESVAFFSWLNAYIETLWVLFFQQISLDNKKDEEDMVEEKIVGEIPTPEAV